MSRFKSGCQGFENSITAVPGHFSNKYCGIYAVVKKKKWKSQISFLGQIEESSGAKPVPLFLLTITSMDIQWREKIVDD